MTTTYETLLIGTDARGVATVTLNRPEKHNALNGTLIAELHDAAGRLAFADNVRIVVLTGVGKSFCAGGDFNWFASNIEKTRAERVAQSATLAQLLHRLDTLPKPLIGRINGPAYGGGVGMISVCDIAVGVDTARFGLTEVRLGLIPANISPHVVARIGAHQARRYFLTAEVFSAEAALQAGLVHRCVPADTLMNEVMATARQLLNNAPRAMATTKNLINYLVPVPASREITDYTAALIARVRTGQEAQGGLQAFLDKQQAPWVQNADGSSERSNTQS